eukprot:1136661-Pelagomonas_calceolata.AAC.4
MKDPHQQHARNQPVSCSRQMRQKCPLHVAKGCRALVCEVPSQAWHRVLCDGLGLEPEQAHRLRTATLYQPGSILTHTSETLLNLKYGTKLHELRF